MKKLFKAAASLAVGCALLSTSAFAALTGSVVESETAGTYTASVTKADATSWESTILVLKAGSVDATGETPVIASTVNDSDICYINQTSATSDTATYSLAQAEETLYVFAGGSDETAALYLGSIDAKVEEPTGAEAIAITLNGQEVTEASVNILSTIKFDAAITGTAASDVVWTVDDGGVGTIENGLYTPAEFLDDPFDSTGIGEFTVTATVDGKSDTVKLRVWRYGDVTGDGMIDTDDSLSIQYFNMYMYDDAGVLGSFNGDPYAPNPEVWAEAAADVTGDGMIDTDDSLNVDYYSMYMFDDSVLDGLMPQ